MSGQDYNHSQLFGIPYDSIRKACIRCGSANVVFSDDWSPWESESNYICYECGMNT